jgi:hypothetical protein
MTTELFLFVVRIVRYFFGLAALSCGVLDVDRVEAALHCAGSPQPTNTKTQLHINIASVLHNIRNPILRTMIKIVLDMYAERPCPCFSGWT